MVLYVHSDISYLSEWIAWSRAGEYLFLSNNSSYILSNTTSINGVIYVYSTIIKNMFASTVEGELGALFLNAKEEISIRIILDKIDHPQPLTIIHTYNKCDVGIINDTFKQHHHKTVDMRFYWI